MLLETKSPEALPFVPARRPAATFTREQVSRFALTGEGGNRASPGIKKILRHVVQLRGEQVTWAFDLPLPQLFGRPAHTVRFCRPTFVAPLTIFKTAGGLFIPKIIISSGDDLDLDLGTQIGLSAACRGSSIETLCISDQEIAWGYLESKKFKRALYGAFFCDADTNRTVYLPSSCVLAESLYEWPANREAQRSGRPVR